jgi:hypothetical protein
METEKCPGLKAQRHFCGTVGAVRALGANADYIGLAYHHNSPRTRAVAGDVSLAMAIATDEPLLVKPIGMLGDTGEVYRFIGSRLLSHHLTALFATFSRHSFLLLHLLTYMKTDRTSARVPVPIFNLW